MRLRIESMRAISTALGELPWPTAQFTILTRSDGFSLRLGLAAFLATTATQFSSSLREPRFPHSGRINPNRLKRVCGVGFTAPAARSRGRLPLWLRVDGAETVPRRKTVL